MKTDNKVWISNITSDKVVGKDIIDGGLHHFVCDKTYPNGKVGVLAYDNGQIRKVKECKYRKISYLEQSWLLYSFTKRTCHRY